MRSRFALLMAFLLVSTAFLFGCGGSVDASGDEDKNSPAISENGNDVNADASAENETDENEKIDKEKTEENSETDTDNSTKDKKANDKTEKASEKKTDNSSSKKNKTDTSVNKNSNSNKSNATSSGGTNSNGSTSGGNGSNGSSGSSTSSGGMSTETNGDSQSGVTDSMGWPSNEYTSLLPKPSKGTVKKVDTQDGIYCILLTGADMIDAKTYAASLINYGYTSEVTETIEENLYLFGGGNSSGAFVVVSYQDGQFIIGIQK